jgi:hypothetical protein
MPTRDKLPSLVNRLEMHMKDSKVSLLIEEASDTLVEQDKRIRDLESMLDMMDGALCNYINNCNDPYEPASKWDESTKRDFEKLCEIYNKWHKINPEIGKISMDRYIEEQDLMKGMIVRSLKDSLYRANANAESREIIERVIRRYEDYGVGVI